MKKFYIFMAFVCIAAFANAQLAPKGKLTVNKDSRVAVPYLNHQDSKTVNDTMGINYAFDNGTDQYYYDPYNFFSTAGILLGGFIASPDLINFSTFSAEGVIWRIYMKHAKVGSTLDSKVYLTAGEYVITASDTTMTPYAMDSITFADLDTAAQWNTVLFDAPVSYSNCIRPFVYVDFKQAMIAGDTIFGLELDGTYTDMDCTVEISQDGGSTWDYYGLTTPLFFEAWVIAENTTSIVGSDSYFSGMQLSQNYPNPSLDGTTTINYAVNKSFKNVTLDIIDANGRVVESVNQGSKDAGSYSIQLNTKLATGMYYYSLVADGNRFTKKMIVK